MFCGTGGLEIAKSDWVGGNSAAAMYCQIGTVKLNDIESRELMRCQTQLLSVAWPDSPTASPKSLNEQPRDDPKADTD
jgi:hypothetical protein